MGSLQRFCHRHKFLVWMKALAFSKPTVTKGESVGDFKLAYTVPHQKRIQPHNGQYLGDYGPHSQ